ncbi:MAG: TRAP transporter substrate-binding protein [Clostridiales Family XIII bacterium]|jgi:tripartite ATP-independent transporter DctP family solute receptor|nr:TRAP transporter substrate-binding protein [Clostridiales Family XIII bacterium]
MKKLLVLLMIFTMVLMTACQGGGEEQENADAADATDAADTADTSSASADEEVYTLKIGGTVPDTHPITIALYKFAEDINAKSEGRIQASFFPNNQVGSGRELFEAVQVNNLQMCENSIAAIAAFTDKYMVLSLPFLFPSRDVAYAFADSSHGTELSDEVAAETGIKVVGYYENGIRQLTNSKRPISAPADLKGIKVRVMDSPMFIKMFEAMGASPTPMAFAELFTALQQKTIDGQDNPYTIVVTNKFYEAQTYITNLEHCFDYTVVAVNVDFYNSLPEDLKAIFDECMADSVKYQRELSIEAEKENLATIKEYLEFTELTPEQREVFRKACEPVYDWFKDTYDKDGRLDKYLTAIEELS